MAIASSVMLHEAQIMVALGAGRHVLTEKCFTVGLAGAEACVAQAERHDRRLMVVQNARLFPPMRTLRRLVREAPYGPLGLFFQGSYKARRGPYNPSPHMHLWQQGVHELDTLLGIIQRPALEVRWGPGQARSETIAVDAPDTRGLEHHPAARAALEAGAGGAGTGRALNTLVDLTIYRDLYEYVTAGAEPESSGRRNLETIRLLDAIQRSTETGRPVDLADSAPSADQGTRGG